MAAGNLKLYVEQGATFQIKLTIKDANSVAIDLTGRTFRGQIRKTAGSTTSLATFTFDVRDQNTYPGEVYMKLTPAETSALPVTKSAAAERTIVTYTYDVEMVYPDNSVDRILEGLVDVSPEVTIT